MVNTKRNTSTNVTCESYPWEWQEDAFLAQTYNAVRIVSLVQLVYSFLAYMVVAADYLVLKDDKPSIYDTLQAPGGISLLSFIAAVAMRFGGDGAVTIRVAKIYAALTGLDLLAWGAGTGYKIYQVIPMVKSDTSAAGIIQHTSLLSLHLFVGILLLVCLVDALGVIGKGAQQTYSLLADTDAPLPVQKKLDYYPLKRLCAVQFSYAVFGAIIPVVATYFYSDLASLTLLISPGAGLFTILATLSVFFQLFEERLPTNYSVMIAVDLITGVMKLVGAFTYGLFKYPDANGKEAFFVPGAIMAAFPIFYMLLGVIIAYRTRIHVLANKKLSTQVDGVFAI